jgi:hypothetical protein
MLREIITPQSDKYTVQIPKEYINTKVEILVLPFTNQDDKKIDNKNSDALLHQLDKVISTKSKDSLQIDNDTILNPHKELSNDIS